MEIRDLSGLSPWFRGVYQVGWPDFYLATPQPSQITGWANCLEEAVNLLELGPTEILSEDRFVPVFGEIESPDTQGTRDVFSGVRRVGKYDVKKVGGRATSEEVYAAALLVEAARALAVEAHELLEGEQFGFVAAEIERLGGDDCRDFSRRVTALRERAPVFRTPRAWGNYAERIRVTATNRKSWWRRQLDADLIRIELSRARENLAWLRERVASAPVPVLDFLVPYERGQGSIDRSGWVITPTGERRTPDQIIRDGHHEVARRWFPRAGELLLLWEKRSVAERHEFTVAGMPATVTPAQRAAVRAILTELDAAWETRRGMSGKTSPATGLGWLCPTTGQSIAYRDPQPTVAADPVALAGDRASEAALKALAERFKK